MILKYRNVMAVLVMAKRLDALPPVLANSSSEIWIYSFSTALMIDRLLGNSAS